LTISLRLNNLCTVEALGLKKLRLGDVVAIENHYDYYGRGKGREQFKGVKIDRKLVFAHSPAPERHRLPLFLLGYLS
jgi:hypothetical protein